MSHLLTVFPLIRLHELMPITDAYQWSARPFGIDYMVFQTGYR